MNNPKCHSCMPSGRTRLELASHVGGGGREAEAAKLAEVWLENANWYVSLWFLFFSCDFFWTNRRAADFIEYRWFSCDWHMGGIMFYLFLGVMLDKYQANTPRRYHVTWNRQTAIQNLLETIFAMILKKKWEMQCTRFYGWGMRSNQKEGSEVNFSKWHHCSSNEDQKLVHGPWWAMFIIAWATSMVKTQKGPFE